MALSEETSPPQGESLVASCTLEFDDESSQPEDVEVFQSNVHSAIAAFCKAVHDELRQHQLVSGAAAAADRDSSGNELKTFPQANGTT
jgi:hypothetical protein